MYLCGDKPVYDEEGIWEMVDGYSQIRDDGSAVISWFSEVNDWEWYTYVLVVVSVVLTLAIGLGFVRYEEETIQSNKNKKGRSYGSKHHAFDDYRNCRRRVLLFQWAQSS